MEPLLDTTNSQSLVYRNEFLQQTVLGGVKVEGLDRMRVTLKVELVDSSRPPVRHNLDLYNDNQLEKFIRKIAERLEIGTSVISASLSELTEQLEKYRLDQQAASYMEEKPVVLTLEQIEKAKDHLKQPELLAKTSQDLQDSGIQGEQNNALILLLAMTSRKLSDPLSVICLAKSGTGKSYLMEKVAQCMPKEEAKEHTQFSGNSFYYFKREEIKGTVFLIEDLDGAQDVMFPIRELQTKKRISKTVTMKDRTGQMRTITLIVEGPVSVIGCTTKEKVYEDNANRALLIYLDGSKEQDDRVMAYQKALRAGLVDSQSEKGIQTKLEHMQRVLEPVKVVNPYAPLIEVPKEDFKPRRTLPILLSFIETIAFYHQYQREQKVDTQTGEIYIEVHPQDVEAGYRLLKDVLFKKADELSGAAREFFQLVSHKSQLNDPNLNGGKGFYGREVRQHIRIHPRTLNRYLNELAEYGLLQVTGGNKHTTGYSYRIASETTYKDLQKSVAAQVEKVIENVWSAYDEANSKKSKKVSKTAVGQ